MTPKRPKPPKALGKAGKALWLAILADLDEAWQLDARELHLLERACRCSDEMTELEQAVDRDGATATGSKGQVVAHPGILEARQLRLTQLRLLAALELEDPEGAARRSTPATKRARKAAGARWGNRHPGSRAA